MTELTSLTEQQIQEFCSRFKTYGELHEFLKTICKLFFHNVLGTFICLERKEEIKIPTPAARWY